MFGLQYNFVQVLIVVEYLYEYPSVQYRHPLSMLAGGHRRYKTQDGMENTSMANKRVRVASK